jgi:6-phosphogluconolactonase
LILDFLPMPDREIIFCEYDDDVADAAAQIIFDAQREAIDERGVFRIALSGGSTPQKLYQLLASGEWKNEMAWENWEIFWSDERAVPPTDENSNYKLANDALLSKIPAGDVWRMPGEKPDLTEAANEYARTLKSRFAPSPIQFDIVLLGMGPDGHTASLFPNHPALESIAIVDAVEVDQKIRRRLTLTLPVLNDSRIALFLVTGESKAKMCARILDQNDLSLPAARILPPDGRSIWILDEAAAHLLE